MQMQTAIRKPPKTGKWDCSTYCLAERAWRGECEDVTSNVGAMLAMVFLEMAAEGMS